MKYIFLLAVVVVTLVSCRGKIACKNGDVGLLIFQETDSTIAVNDTLVLAYRYPHDGRFSQSDTCFTTRVHCASTQVGRLLSVDVYNVISYDWKFVLFPSGKEYYLKDGHYVSRRDKNLYDSYKCWNSIVFTCNGKTVVLTDWTGYCYINIDY